MIKTAGIPFGKKISELKPDRHLMYTVHEKQVLRFLQEGTPSYVSNFVSDHENFWKLVSEMRYAHKHLMDVALVQKQEFHDKLGTFGILTSTSAIVLLKITSDISQKKNRYELGYKLSIVDVLNKNTNEKDEKIRFYSELLVAFHEIEEQNVIIREYLKKSLSDTKTIQESPFKTKTKILDCQIGSRMVSVCRIPIVFDTIHVSTDDYFLAEAQYA